MGMVPLEPRNPPPDEVRLSFAYSVLNSTPRIAIFNQSTISSLETEVADKFTFNDFIVL